MLERDKENYLIIGSDVDINELNNLNTYIKQFGKKSEVINSINSLETVLNSYSQKKSSKTVILDLFYYKNEFDQLFNKLSSFQFRNDLIIISFFMEMDYIISNPALTHNTYIVSQYLERNDDFKLKEMLGNDVIDNTIYLTYLSLYFANSTISMFYIKDTKELSSKMERMMEISGIKRMKYYNNNFIIPSCLLKVENGVIIEEYDLYCDSNIYINDLWFNLDKKICVNGKEEVANNFIEIGYMGKKENLHYYSILRGIYESADYSNSDNYSSFHYILKIVIAPYSLSISKQYQYLLSNKVSVVIYYMSTDMLDDLLDVINESDPYLFTVGYSSGEICFPNVFHIGTNIPTQIHFYNYFYSDRSMFLLYSNTPYFIIYSYF